MLMHALAALLRTRGPYAETERLYRESLAVKEALGDSRSVAVTQSSLALVMLARGEYGEAERLLKQALETMRQVRDLRSVAAIQMQWGTLMMQREQSTAGHDLLAQARRGFVAIGLPNWAAIVNQILANFEK